MQAAGPDPWPSGCECGGSDTMNALAANDIEAADPLALVSAHLDPLADRHPPNLASSVQETGRRSGADGSIVTGTPCPALADPGPAWLSLSGKQTPRSTEAFLRFADRGHGPGIPPDAGVNKLRLVVTDVPDAASRHLCQRRCLERLAASSARCWRLPRAGGNRRDSRLGGEKSRVRDHGRDCAARPAH